MDSKKKKNRKLLEYQEVNNGQKLYEAEKDAGTPLNIDHETMEMIQLSRLESERRKQELLDWRMKKHGANPNKNPDIAKDNQEIIKED